MNLFLVHNKTKNLSLVFAATVGLFFLYSCRLLDDSSELSRRCGNNSSCEMGYECQSRYCQYVGDMDLAKDIVEELGEEDLESEDLTEFCADRNPCGGCTVLTAELGEPCEECGLWVCDGIDEIRCGEILNRCGNCGLSGPQPDDPCDFGYYTCGEGSELVCNDPRIRATASSCLRGCDSPEWWISEQVIDSNLLKGWSSEMKPGPFYAEWVDVFFEECEINEVRIWPMTVNGLIQHVPAQMEIYYAPELGGEWVKIKRISLAEEIEPGYTIFFDPVRTNGIMLRSVELRHDGNNNYYFQLAEVVAGCP